MNGTKIARLFKRKTKTGKVYLEGKMTEISRLIIVENDRKDSPKEPDYYAYVVPNRGPRALDDADLGTTAGD